MIHYRITPSHPKAHRFHVQIEVRTPEPQQAFWLPAWIPGSYMIRNFSRHLIDLHARDSQGNPVELQQIDKQTWRLAKSEALSVVWLTYDVYAWDHSVRAAHLDQSHGYFNGTSVFLAVKNREKQPCTVTLCPPNGDVDGQWRVGTAMSAAAVDAHGFGRYEAADYDELIDHPVEMADFTHGSFETDGVPHEVIISGRHRADMDRLTQDLTRICHHHIQFWGEPAPMNRYVFMTMAVKDGYGGLEHRASTSLMAKRDDLPQRGMTTPSAGYANYLGLCSHEYFHSWNVKRLKPRQFLPYGLTQESYTELLWWFEGITSYYDDLGVLRAGCTQVEQYLELLSQTLTRVHRGQGRFRQSIAESSFNAWTKFYLQDENAPNAIVSYYAKGELFALYLDLSIRQRTGNKQSLDDLVRAVWQAYRDSGVPEAGIPAVAEEVIDCDLSDVFTLGVHGREDLPLKELLADFGVTATWSTPVSLNLPGGKLPYLRPGQVSLGAMFDPAPDGARVRAVLEDSPAQKAGLSAGDVVIAVDRLQTDHAKIDQQFAQFTDGESVLLHFFRDDVLREAEATAEAGPDTTCVLAVEDPARVRTWLGKDVAFRQPAAGSSFNLS